MSWNYRMVRDIYGNYGICDVYYVDGVPVSRTKPIDLIGDSSGEVENELELMRGALKKSILEEIKVTSRKGEDKLVLREVR